MKFVIGDNPLVRWDEEKQVWNVGTSQPNTEITMPLTKRLYVCILNETSRHLMRIVVSASAEQTHRYNLRQRCAATKYLYASRPELLKPFAPFTWPQATGRWHEQASYDSYTTHESKIHWNYFLALENDLDRLSRYVEFTTPNYPVYSIELRSPLTVRFIRGRRTREVVMQAIPAEFKMPRHKRLSRHFDRGTSKIARYRQVFCPHVHMGSNFGPMDIRFMYPIYRKLQIGGMHITRLSTNGTPILTKPPSSMFSTRWALF